MSGTIPARTRHRILQTFDLLVAKVSLRFTAGMPRNPVFQTRKRLAEMGLIPASDAESTNKKNVPRAKTAVFAGPQFLYQVCQNYPARRLPIFPAQRYYNVYRFQSFSPSTLLPDLASHM